MFRFLRKRRFWLELAIWMALLVGVYYVTQWRGSSSALAVPTQLPPISVRSLSGQVLALPRPPQQMMLINFWSPDCPPCLAETPALVQLQQWFGGNRFSVVGIAVDGSSTAAVRARMREFGINYPIYLASGQGASEAVGGVLLTPTSLLVNDRGRIIGRYVGAVAVPVVVWKIIWTWI
ncbi:TlpA disulfide reductase family protein [Acidithiobacillus sp. AMEEHan]|uniref:TlpA disulfide reductase family protein n=1 Tax=Acidithiobacillus sp. AMEEHan TaxID=2994951 RepID=UPI0027E5221A|nr:TlpA disulfide reductase family protein [Acidithiobacillus sp. AMEEHan]